MFIFTRTRSACEPESSKEQTEQNYQMIQLNQRASDSKQSKKKCFCKGKHWFDIFSTNLSVRVMTSLSCAYSKKNVFYFPSERGNESYNPTILQSA